MGPDADGSASAGDERVPSAHPRALSGARTRERFLALYEITQESCATHVAERTRRHPQTVMEWLHLYNTRGPEALAYKRTGGRPPFPRTSRQASARRSVRPNAPPQFRR